MNAHSFALLWVVCMTALALFAAYFGVWSGVAVAAAGAVYMAWRRGGGIGREADDTGRDDNSP
jgi:hypothetical protein